jgi:hypothetical protein
VPELRRPKTQSATIEPALRELAQRRDFAGACALIESACRHQGRVLARESLAVGAPYDAQFWPRCAREAARAARIYEAALRLAAERMRDEGLAHYADALDQGDYGALGF